MIGFLGVVVRCVGEEQTPALFNVYGPKIIAARDPFGDEATESRTLTHISYQTRTKRHPN
jgi:hypothetical protein